MPAVIPARTGGAQPCPDPPAHQSALLELHAVSSSAPRARAWARQVLREWRLDDLADAAEALIAELAANALDASARVDQPVICIALAFSHGELAILVADGDPAMPEAQAPDKDAESGRGLLIVTALSSRFGWYPLTGGSAAKVVWAVLPDPAAGPSEGPAPQAPAWPGNTQPGPRRGPLPAAGHAGLAVTTGTRPLHQPAAGL